MGEKRKITKADYYALITEVYGEVKRDIFTEDLYAWDKRRKKWSPLLSNLMLGKLRSVIRDKEDSGWSVSALEDHIQSLTYETKASLMVDIPDWDQTERIGAFADNLEVEGYTSQQLKEIFITWGATMFRRLQDPSIQNRIIILLGEQGLGKDTFIRQMVGGLEHLFTGFTVQQNESDTLNLITSTLCVHIEEFDRTHKQDTGLIKTIITGESFTFRGAYERKAERRKNRASFIGSCNTADLLREPGANRRFIILPIKEIGRKYPMGESKQVLAEFKHWNKEGFKASQEAEEAIKVINEELSPLDVEEEIVSHYLRLIKEDVQIYWEPYQGAYSALSSSLSEIWKELAKETGHSIQTVRNVVKRKGYAKKTENGTRYFKDKFGKNMQKIAII